MLKGIFLLTFLLLVNNCFALTFSGLGFPTVSKDDLLAVENFDENVQLGNIALNESNFFNYSITTIGVPSLLRDRALGGDREGNGGDLEIAFSVDALRKIHDVFSKQVELNEKIPHGVTPILKLLNSQKGVDLICSDSVILKGRKVDAANYSIDDKKIIVLNCSDLNVYSSNVLARLLLHELLPLVGINDQDYRASSELYIHYLNHTK